MRKSTAKKQQTPHLPSQTISRAEMRLTLKMHQELRENSIARNFYFWSVAGYHLKDKETGYTLMPYRFLANMFGIISDTKENKGEYLDWYQENFVPEFVWRDYWYQGKKVRAMVNNGAKEQAERILTTNPRLLERVYIDTLKKVTARTIADRYREEKKACSAFVWQCQEMTAMAAYLNGNLLKLYMDFVEKNYDEAFAYAVLAGDETLLRNLHRLIDNPMPLYRPQLAYDLETDTGSRTYRIFSTLVQFLSKPCRKILFKGCIEMDIKNCQLTIAAYVFDIPSAKAFLGRGTSIWDVLLDWMELPYEAKPMIKKALYSLIYGMKRQFVAFHLRNELKAAGYRAKRSMLKHSVIKDVAAAIERVKERIVAEGGAMGAFGWMPLGTQEINSFLACLVQSYELALTHACYEIAIAERKHRHDQSTIILHQHDGFLLMLKDGADQKEVLTRYQKAFARKAEQLGICATLEVEAF